MKNKNLENSLNKSFLRTIFSIFQSILVFGIGVVFVLCLVIYFFFLPKKTFVKSYESENFSVNIYKYTIRLIGDFPAKRVFAEDKNDLFSFDKLLYSTEYLNNDSLSISFLNENIIRIDAYDNDTIIRMLSCEYDFEVDTDPCIFYASGKIIQH